MQLEILLQKREFQSSLIVEEITNGTVVCGNHCQLDVNERCNLRSLDDYRRVTVASPYAPVNLIIPFRFIFHIGTQHFQRIITRKPLCTRRSSTNLYLLINNLYKGFIKCISLVLCYLNLLFPLILFSL